MSMMPEYIVVTGREAKRFKELSTAVPAVDEIVFLDHDEIVQRYWPLLPSAFPDYQFCMVEHTTGRAVARGHSLPVVYDDPWSSLPDEGFDWVLEKGFLDRDAGQIPTVLSALYIVISDTFRGKNLSTLMLDAMRQIGRDKGLTHLIVPLRPSVKSLYPLIDIDEYCRWRDPNGEPFDSWLRVHVRAGGKVIQTCRRAMTVSESRQQWSEWTGMDFPGDGNYVIPHALVPLTVRGNLGSYVEPGIWVVHDLQEECS